MSYKLKRPLKMAYVLCKNKKNSAAVERSASVVAAVAELIE